MTINIQPVPGWPKPGIKLRINSCAVVLGETATLDWSVTDEDGKISATSVSRLTPEQYAGWIGDDAYVARCVAANVGLTPA